MISDEKIDAILLANVNNQWQKVALVVGATMMQIDSIQRVGLDDLYFAKRAAVLVEKGIIESSGELNEMRHCEVRLSPNFISR